MVPSGPTTGVETGYVPGHFRGARQFSGVEAQSMLEHWSTFIQMLAERGFRDEEIGMIVGGNFLRVMREVLPA